MFDMINEEEVIVYNNNVCIIQYNIYAEWIIELACNSDQDWMIINVYMIEYCYLNVNVM